MGPLDTKTAQLDWIDSISELLPQDRPYPTGEPFYPNVLCRTLIANVTYYGTAAPEIYLSFFHEFLAITRAIVAPNFDSDTCISKDKVHPVNFFFVAQPSTCYSRKVFSTDHGYLGLGPLDIRQGDIICILLGATVPFILRKRENGGYALVGECCVHGLMNGEGLNKGVEEDIVLY